MLDINLLPWRSYQRNRRRKMLNMVLSIFVSAMLLSLLSMHCFLKNTITNHYLRIRHLESQLNLLQVNYIQAKNHINQLQKINSLKQYDQMIMKKQNALLAVINHLANQIPAGIVFTQIMLYADSVDLVGLGASISDLQMLIKVFPLAQLVLIQNKMDDSFFLFKLHFML